MRVERLDESAWNHWSNDRGMGGRTGVEYAAMLPICLLYALWQAQAGHAVFGGHDAVTLLLLVPRKRSEQWERVGFGFPTQARNQR